MHMQDSIYYKCILLGFCHRMFSELHPFSSRRSGIKDLASVRDSTHKLSSHSKAEGNFNDFTM